MMDEPSRPELERLMGPVKSRAYEAVHDLRQTHLTDLNRQ
jgi:hypothetical protein